MSAPPRGAPSWLSHPTLRNMLVMSSLMGAWGVAAPFLPRWLEGERGLTGGEIGAVLAAPQIARVLVGAAIAGWADGFADRVTPVRTLCVLALIGYGLFFFAAHDFWSLFLIGFIATSLGQALGPLTETAVLRISQTGPISFGQVRAFGSTLFIAGNVGGGALLAAYGLGVVPAWVLGGIALMTAFAFTLPSDPPARIVAGFRARLALAWAFVRRRRIALLLIGASLVQGAHAFYYGFSALLWRAQGVGEGTIGLLWAFGVTVEVAFLLLLTRIERRVTPEMLLVAGATGATLRWSVLAFAPPEAMLWLLQPLHALSFAATHVGALRLLTREAPEEVLSLAQMAYAALHAGLVMGGATLLGGWLYDHVGAGGYAAMALLASGGFACLLALLRETGIRA